MSFSKNPLVIHHNDHDGWAAAWVLRNYHAGLDEVDFLEVRYGDPVPDLSERSEVWIVDFSWAPYELFPAIEAAGDSLGKLYLLDHHKTAADLWTPVQVEAARTLGHTVLIDQDRAGCQITWDFLQEMQKAPTGENTTPLLVQYIADRDLWRFELDYSNAINLAIMSRDLNFDVLDDLHEDMMKSKNPLIHEGLTLLRQKRINIAQMMKHTQILFISGCPVAAVNACSHMSDLGHDLASHYGIPGCVWFIQGNGNIKVSFRSLKHPSRRREPVTARTLATLLGGGGHDHAAAARVPMDQWAPYLKNARPAPPEVVESRNLEEHLLHWAYLQGGGDR